MKTQTFLKLKGGKMFFMIVRLTKGELVKQVSFIDDNEANDFAGLHGNVLRFVNVIAHGDGDRSGRLRCLCRLAERELIGRSGKRCTSR